MPRAAAAPNSCASASRSRRAMSRSPASGESRLTSTLVEPNASTRAQATSARAKRAAKASSGPQLSIRSTSAGSSRPVARSPRSQRTPSAAGCGRRESACTSHPACTSSASSGRPIWPLPPNTSARPGEVGRCGRVRGATMEVRVIGGRIAWPPRRRPSAKLGCRHGACASRRPAHPGFPMLNLLLALPFAAALAIALAPGASRRTVAWMAAAAPLLGLGLLAWLTPAVMGGQVPASSLDWLPQAGLAFSLRLDGLAWMFAGLVLGIGALIVLYAHYYLSEDDSARRFFGYLLLFMGAMLGMVLAGNLLLLVVFWELTSISSFLLIGFWSHRQDARQGARMALSITGMGGLALLGGVLLIGRVTGSYELDVVLASGDAIRASTLYPAILALVLAGVFTKSAQFPLHFWLPQAMAAPTPVSAYLHSATMVKAGVFLLARLHPALAGT